MNQRIEWIDKAKAIALFFVLFGHVVRVEALYAYISHVIPFFFFITGLLISERSVGLGFWEYLETKARRRLAPYLFFGAVTYAVWLAWSLRDVYFRNEPHDLLKPLAGMVYGVGTLEWLPHNVPLWFLPCLFVSDLLFYFSYRVAGKSWKMLVLLFALSLAGYGLDLIDAWRLPWSADSALTAVLFMGAGFLFRDAAVGMRLGLWKACLFLAAGAVLAVINEQANLNYNRYGNILIFWASSFCGIVGWMEVAKALPDMRLLTSMGRSTLSLFALQGLSATFLSQAFEHLFGLDVNVLHAAPAGSIATAVAFALLGVAMVLPIDRLLARRMPAALGLGPTRRKRERAGAPLIEDQAAMASR